MTYTSTQILTFDEFIIQFMGETYIQRQFRLGESISSPYEFI
jgi:hypothetical protein